MTFKTKRERVIKEVVTFDQKLISTTNNDRLNVVKVNGSDAKFIWVISYEVLVLKVIDTCLPSEETNTDPIQLLGMEAEGFNLIRLNTALYLHA